MSAVCPCGDPTPHVIIRRTTYDGLHVLGWCDGAISGVLGYRLPEVPMRRPKTAAAIGDARAAMALFMGEVGVHTGKELSALYDACVKVGRGRGTPGDVRALLAKPASIPLPWRIVGVDRQGKTAEKQAVFRLGLLRGIAVIWTRNRGYEVGHVKRGSHISRDTAFVPSGITLPNLERLQEHLRAIAKLNAETAAEGGR